MVISVSMSLPASISRDHPQRSEYVFEADRLIAAGVVVLRAIFPLTADLSWT
jgi:hypothetical protein